MVSFVPEGGEQREREREREREQASEQDRERDTREEAFFSWAAHIIAFCSCSKRSCLAKRLGLGAGIISCHRFS
jgi:hypothetical protein